MHTLGNLTWQSEAVCGILGHTPPIKLLLPYSTLRERVMLVDGDFPFTCPFITGEGPEELGIEKGTNCPWPVTGIFGFNLIQMTGTGAFSSYCVLPKSGWMDVSSVLTRELKLFGLHLHTLYKIRINTYELLPPSALPASNTCSSKVLWVAYQFYIFNLHIVCLYHLLSCWIVQFLVPRVCTVWPHITGRTALHLLLSLLVMLWLKA